jgi:DNA-binding transcriptional MerR regulator
MGIARIAEVTSQTSPEPGYAIGALARRLGVATATLRDWELRYGLGPAGRSAGGHRRYQPADVARIEYMRRLVLAGLPPAEAARAALSAQPAPESAATGPAWGTGGRSLSLPDQLPATRGLARAALALDAGAIAQLLDYSLDQAGVVQTWDQLATPVLNALGQEQAATGQCVDVEHVLSAQLLTAFAARVQQLSRPVNRRTIVLACTEHEQHSLPLFALAAALAERQVATTMLGARTPPPALAQAIERTGPAAVFLWSHTPDTAQIAEIPRQRPPLRLLLAGPGWRPVPAGARLVTTLTEAVQAALESVGQA